METSLWTSVVIFAAVVMMLSVMVVNANKISTALDSAVFNRMGWGDGSLEDRRLERTKLPEAFHFSVVRNDNNHDFEPSYQNQGARVGRGNSNH